MAAGNRGDHTLSNFRHPASSGYEPLWTAVLLDRHACAHGYRENFISTF